jgi:hypothetical protein
VRTAKLFVAARVVVRVARGAGAGRAFVMCSHSAPPRTTSREGVTLVLRGHNLSSITLATRGICIYYPFSCHVVQVTAVPVTLRVFGFNLYRAPQAQRSRDPTAPDMTRWHC